MAERRRAVNSWSDHGRHPVTTRASRRPCRFDQPSGPVRMQIPRSSPVTPSEGLIGAVRQKQVADEVRVQDGLAAKDPTAASTAIRGAAGGALGAGTPSMGEAQNAAPVLRSPSSASVFAGSLSSAATGTRLWTKSPRCIVVKGLRHHSPRSLGRFLNIDSSGSSGPDGARAHRRKALPSHGVQALRERGSAIPAESRSGRPDDQCRSEPGSRRSLR